MEELPYKVFETYEMREEQKLILDLMKKYSDTTDLKSWHVLYTETQISYCRDIGDKAGLLAAYEKYYSGQQSYHNNSVKQKQEYIGIELHSASPCETLSNKYTQ